MGAMSRRKGAKFEREIAGELHSLLGITFKRDLDQYRERDRGDLIPSDPDFPFLIECKRFASGVGCKREWWSQAVSAALEARKRPAVIYRYDGRQPRVCLSARDVVECITRGGWSGAVHLMDMDLEAFAYVAREGMCVAPRATVDVPIRGVIG